MSVQVLVVALGVVVLPAVAALLNALRIKARTVPLPPEVLDDQSDRYAGDLAELLKIPTVSGREDGTQETHRQFVRFQAKLWELFPLVHERMERIDLGSDALLLRWRGKDTGKGAIVLMAHSDVVPAKKEAWTHDPYGGMVDEKRVWGRGAVDTKGSLCAILEALESLMATGFVPSGDVYLSSSDNEETMGDGAVRAVDYFKKNKIRVALASDEGGAVLEAPMPGLGGYFAMLGIVEKGGANVRLTARSTGGHASAPPPNSPVARLAAFVCHMEKHPPFKRRITRPVRQMFGAMAPYMSFPYRLIFGNIWLFAPLIKAVLPAVSPQAGAMLQTTCAFTMLDGGVAPNVIPESASVTANLRFCIHQPQEQSLALFQKMARQYGLEMEVLHTHDCSSVVDIKSKEFQYVAGCMKAVYPEAVMTPYVITGGTDGRVYSQVCDCVVRCAPLMMDRRQLNSMHGVDENIYIASLAKAVAFYKKLIVSYGECL